MIIELTIYITLTYDQPPWQREFGRMTLHGVHAENRKIY